MTMTNDDLTRMDTPGSATDVATASANKNAPATSGPWKAGQETVYSFTEKFGDIVCQRPDDDCEASLAHWPANAHLIAAAPDLLAALRLALAELIEAPCRDNLAHSRCMKCAAEGAARTAIAKAEGRA